MKIATWNINGVKARHRGRPHLAQGDEARRRLPAGDQERHRGLSRRGLRGARLQRRRARPEGLQRRRHPVQAPLRRGGRARPARRRERRHARYIEVLVPSRRRRRARRQSLPAQRQPDRHRQVRLQARLDAALGGAHAASCWRWRSRSCCSATTTSSPSRSTPRTPQAWREDALFQPETRAAFRALLNLGLTDALRACLPGPGIYTFWDYQAGAWQKDHGIRIDHILASPQAADRLQSAGVDKFTRGWEKPSDHVPVWVELRE